MCNSAKLRNLAEEELVENSKSELEVQLWNL